MDGKPVFTDVILNGTSSVSALIDEGCQCYAAIHGDLVKQLGLQLVDDAPRRMRGATEAMKDSRILGVVGLRVGIGGFHQTVYAYVVPKLSFPLILGNPWKSHNAIRTAPDEGRFFHGRADIWIQESRKNTATENARLLLASAKERTAIKRKKESLRKDA